MPNSYPEIVHPQDFAIHGKKILTDLLGNEGDRKKACDYLLDKSLNPKCPNIFSLIAQSAVVDSGTRTLIKNIFENFISKIDKNVYVELCDDDRNNFFHLLIYIPEMIDFFANACGAQKDNLIKAENISGIFPLLAAAQFHNVAAMDALVKQGADVNQRFYRMRPEEDVEAREIHSIDEWNVIFEDDPENALLKLYDDNELLAKYDPQFRLGYKSSTRVPVGIEDVIWLSEDYGGQAAALDFLARSGYERIRDTMPSPQAERTSAAKAQKTTIDDLNI